MDAENGKNFIDAISRLDSWQAFSILILVAILYFALKSNLVDRYFTSKRKDKETLQKKEAEGVKQLLIQQGLMNIEAAAHHAVESVPHCIGANYYIIHDSGRNLDEIDEWYLTVFRSTSFAVGADYSEPVLMGDAFKWLNRSTVNKGFFYVADTYNEKNMVGSEMEYMKAMSIKGVAVCLVRNERKVYHMVSLNFDRVLTEENCKDLRKVLFEFKRMVLQNIVKK